MTSEPQKEIFEYVKSMGFDATCEARIGGLKYDVFVPSAALAIEYHGLAWHSTSSSKRADLNKQAVAAKHEVCLIVIYEDEWREKRKQMCDIMSNRLGAAKSVRKVRPSKCEMMEIPSSAADVFYERNHYIGKTGSNLNVCAMLDGKIVACMSFKRPNRQSKHTFELTRMASDPEYRIHGIWSKMFKILVGKTNPESVVSFSDNRLFTGNVYEKLGFEHDGNVRPNYYWVKGRYRFNKSGLRKPPGTTQTEHDLRMSQGYAKLWDLGKKRWVWRAEQD
jgi:RimJ/RimL family protein N-acetyltransferase